MVGIGDALSGLRILEAGSGVAVRYLGRLFAAMGAEVVALPRCDGDGGLGYGGAAGEAYGAWLDEGKQLASQAEGRFDVIVCGQTAEELTAGEAFHARHGGLVVGLTWFDPAGPYGTWRATDETILALNGCAFGFGRPEGPPMLAHGHGPQVTAGVVAFNAVLAALLLPPEHRPRRVDVNVLEASLCYAETGAVTAAKTGAVSQRLGANRFVPTYPASAYRTSDGWVGITCLTPAQWTALVRLLNRPELAEAPGFATAYERLLNADAVDALLAEGVALCTQAEWVALGIAHRIPIAPMSQPGDLPQVEHWRTRAAFAPVGETPVEGPALPYRMRFSGPAEPAPASDTTLAPLAGLRVADFSMGWSGPLCARTLADLGAEVIKIESEGHPDWWRGWDAGSVDVATREGQLNFINVNRNKRGVDIDLTTAEGKVQAKALIAGADVVVENYAAGVLKKLGLGKDVQQELRPGVIALTMPAFGSDGPLAGLRAYGSTVEQASGMPFVNGEADWPPAQQHVALGDAIAGLYAASAILAALHARSRLGGADIDLAQVACLFQLAADAILAEQVTGERVGRTGHNRPRLAMCAVVRCAEAEDWLAVATCHGEDGSALARVTGGQDLAIWASGRAPAEAAHALQAAGVAAAPVLPPHALTRDAHLEAVGYFLPMQRDYVDHHLVAASPFRFDGQRPPLRRPAPTLGQHTAEVLAELAPHTPAAS